MDNKPAHRLNLWTACGSFVAHKWDTDAQTADNCKQLTHASACPFFLFSKKCKMREDLIQALQALQGNMNEDEKKQALLAIDKIQEDLLKPMLIAEGLKASDRDPTAGNLFFAYSNFQEFYEDLKKYPLARFSTVDLLFSKLIEIYFCRQLQNYFPVDQKWENEPWREFIRSAVKDKEEEFVKILKEKYPRICAEIEKNRNTSPIF